MGKVICFIYDQMADFELTLACHMISDTGREIIPAAYEMKDIKSKPGIVYKPLITIKEAVELEDVDGLIIPGGWNGEHRPELTELIRKLDSEGKLLGAICAGPRFLAGAGVLKGKKYTTTLGENYFSSRGISDPFPRESYVEKRMVRDNNIVTAKGNAFIDFAAEIADCFGLFQDNEERAFFENDLKAK